MPLPIYYRPSRRGIDLPIEDLNHGGLGERRRTSYYTTVSAVEEIPIPKPLSYHALNDCWLKQTVQLLLAGSSSQSATKNSKRPTPIQHEVVPSIDGSITHLSHPIFCLLSIRYYAFSKLHQNRIKGRAERLMLVWMSLQFLSVSFQFLKPLPLLQSGNPWLHATLPLTEDISRKWAFKGAVQHSAS